MLETGGWSDYALLDSGHGRKLERYGGITVVRPEEQAIWAPRLDERTWNAADAEFTGNTDEEGAGRWKARGKLPESWVMAYESLRFEGRFTSFRHVGVFPEQVVHWQWFSDLIAKATSGAGRPVRVLNMFGYTGLASLVAASAGAHVTHVDASKKAIEWARRNQALSGLEDRPIRWICDDAVKFAAREVRRGNAYDGIILDPPKYGRGPKGEVWHLFEGLPGLLDDCRALVSDTPLFFILTAYSIRSSFLTLHEVMADRFADRGLLESGELVLRGLDGGRRLSTSLFTRWSNP